MFWEKRLEKYIDNLTTQHVPMSLKLWNGTQFQLADEPKIQVEVPTLASLRHLFNPTLDKLGEAYVEGKLNVKGAVQDIIDVASQLAGANTSSRMNHRKLPHRAHHTRKLDAESISYHYDVSNDFYQHFLDKNMVYSCAYFKTAQDSLDQAQEQKLDHILTKIQLQPGQTLLDVGCGWGALVLRAAQKYGAKVTGITLSEQQYELAQKRIKDAGLTQQCEIRIQDYRDVKGQFDRITSVGMFEHVGLKNLENYFAKLRSLLAPDGVMMNHGITTTDTQSAGSPAGGGEFIDRYVFPNGELPHISLALQAMCNAGLEPVDIENLRLHYAMTLEHWAQRFEQHTQVLQNLVDEKTFRIWRVYLAGCAHAFRHHWVALHQVVATHEGHNPLPLTRDYMYR